MATMMRHWRLSPAEYWSLRWDERCALVEHMNTEADEADKKRRGKRTGRRRR